MSNREAMKLALEALEWSWGGEPMGTKEQAVMQALRTALAAPSEDIEALRRDAERYRWVLGWLVRSGLLNCEACRIDTPESYGNWWILRKPSSIDGMSFVAYGADLRDAIDAAMTQAALRREEKA